MTNEILKSIRAKLDSVLPGDAQEDAAFKYNVSLLYEAFMRQQFDLEQLAIAYSSILNKNTPLIFYSRQVVSSIRPAKKGRAYVSASAAAGLEKAVKEYGKADAANRPVEGPVTILSEQTTKTEEPKVTA